MCDRGCSLYFLHMVSSFQAQSTEKRQRREAESWKTVMSADCSQSLYWTQTHTQPPSLYAVAH